MFADYVDLPAEERAAFIYERCELDRFGLGTADDGIPLMVWALHHWLLEQDLPAEQARTISLAVLLSDRRAYASAGTYPDRTLPAVAGLEGPRRFGHAIVHVTASAVYLESIKLASVVDGRIDDIALDRDGVLTSLLVRLGTGAERSGRLDIAADRSTPLEAFAQLLRTATRAGYREFSLVVEAAPFEHAPLVFEAARPGTEPELRVSVGELVRVATSCADAAPGSTVEIVIRESSTVGEFADLLAAIWRQPCVARVVLRSIGPS